jgi:hypothetical protein
MQAPCHRVEGRPWTIAIGTRTTGGRTRQTPNLSSRHDPCVPVLEAFSHVPGFLPGVALSVLIGVAARHRIGHALGVRPAFAVALVVSIGTVLAATLTPLNVAEVGGGHPSTCDLSRLTFATSEDLRWTIDVGLNILLFVPLGVLLALLPRSPRKATLIVVALVLPVGIELTQLLAAPLDRACQSGDVIDNLTGLAIGLAIGALAKVLGLGPADPPRRSE